MARVRSDWLGANPSPRTNPNEPGHELFGDGSPKRSRTAKLSSMRREWGTWIKARQWNELEQLAKKDPSQPLADTIAELERGFSDKADRKALRKILFLLGQQGYRPRPIEEPEEEVVPPPEFSFAFMISANQKQSARLTYAYQTRGRVRWLDASIYGKSEWLAVEEEEMSLEDAERAKARQLSMDVSPFEGTVVPHEFVANRLQDALGSRFVLHSPTIATWKSRILSHSKAEHPAATLPRAAQGSYEPGLIAAKDEACLLWWLELGLVDALVMKLTEIATDGIGFEHLQAAAAEVVPPRIVDDYEAQLLDLGYLLHLKGQAERSAVILAEADSLREQGLRSSFMEGILVKSLAIYDARRKDQEAASKPKLVEDIS